MQRDFAVKSGIRPKVLNDMEVLGYKMVGQARYREFYRDAKGNWYSWSYRAAGSLDRGSVYGPLRPL